MGSRTVERIGDVSKLRNYQFPQVTYLFHFPFLIIPCSSSVLVDFMSWSRLSGSRYRSWDRTILRVKHSPPCQSGPEIGRNAGAVGSPRKSVKSWAQRSSSRRSDQVCQRRDPFRIDPTRSTRLRPGPKHCSDPKTTHFDSETPRFAAKLVYALLTWGICGI
jgi:hypothetical protein